MKKYLVLVAFAALFSWGCTQQQTADTSHDHGDHDHGPGEHDHGPGEHDETHAVAAYCGTCGQVAGSDVCCKEGADKCDKCGLHKGAPLCCKLEGDFAGKKLCGKCGQVAKSDACCKEGAEKCDKCGMHKGAPLCCKVGEAHHADEHADKTPSPETPAEEPKEPAETK